MLKRLIQYIVLSFAVLTGTSYAAEVTFPSKFDVNFFLNQPIARISGELSNSCAQADNCFHAATRLSALQILDRFRVVPMPFPADQAMSLAEKQAAFLPETVAMTVGGPTRVPYGWFDFCSRRPDECKVPALAPEEIALTPDVWALLKQINHTANQTIEPVSNLEHWGTVRDHWDYPTDGKGDCKVFALYKRKLLLDAGLPRQALLMTIVRDLDGGGHTILTVKTDHGDFVLDNLAADIRPWNATGYTYLKRQAETNPNVWLDLGGRLGERIEAVASSRVVSRKS